MLFHDNWNRSLTDLKECVMCGEWPFNPQEIGCKHVFCYYCIHVSTFNRLHLNCSATRIDSFIPLTFKSNSLKGGCIDQRVHKFSHKMHSLALCKNVTVKLS